jgi:hypothetical protein
MADDMIKLGRLWKGKAKDGKPYLSGVTADTLDDAVALLCSGGRLLVLANGRQREGKRDPDYELYVVPERRERGERPAADDADDIDF